MWAVLNVRVALSRPALVFLGGGGSPAGYKIKNRHYLAKTATAEYLLLMSTHARFQDKMAEGTKLAFLIPLAAWALGRTAPSAWASKESFKPEAGFVSLYNGKDLTGWSYRDREGKVIEVLDGKTEAAEESCHC